MLKYNEIKLKYKISFFTGISLLIIASLFVLYTEKNKDIENNIIAVVNGEKITVNNFNNQLYKNLNKKDEAINLELKKKILNRLIVEKIIEQESYRYGILVKEQELERYISNIRNDYTEAEFENILLKSVDSYEDWKNSIKRTILIKKTIHEIVLANINVTDAEIKKVYNKMYQKPKNKAEIYQIFTYNKERIIEAKEALNKNKFEEVAFKYSVAPEAFNGGKLGIIEKGEGPVVFDNVFKMEDGEISKILESKHGFHILKLVRKYKEEKKSFLNIKTKIMDSIIKEREIEIYKKWLKEKLDQSEILKNLALLKSIT